jgi:dienelactone hydrolase
MPYWWRDKNNLLYCFTVVLFLFVTGCSGQATRVNFADQLAIAGGFTPVLFVTDSFDLKGYIRISRPGDPVSVYIEGDGQAYISRSRPSRNPTPRNPLALQLALQDDSANVAYIARPCQFRDFDEAPLCAVKYWTTHRFSPEVVQATDTAVNIIARTSNTDAIHLTGYSGGGAVAILVTARRSDVKSLRTVAGYIDHKYLNEVRRVSPLAGSLDPMEVAVLSKQIPQIHYYGTDDEVIPAFVSQRYVSRVGNDRCASSKGVKATHVDNWVAYWANTHQHKPKCR